MHFIAKVAASLVLAGLVAAAPTPSNAKITVRDNGGSSNSTTSGISDADILNYALTLEHLERTFYKEYLDMYNAGAFSDAKYSSWVRQRFTEIAQHERNHVEFLTTALSAAGATPVQACTYDFGVKSPETFVATSQLLEAVGVAAYLGAAPFISNSAYLSAAGSILVDEVQHETWVRSAADTKDPFPRSFPVGLQFNQVYTLVAPLITSCPNSNPALPVKAYPSITIKTEGSYSSGQEISFEVSQDVGAKYAAFVSTVGTVYTPVNGTCGSIKIPDDITGQSYLLLVNSQAVTDDATVAGPAILDIPVPAQDFNYQ